MAITLLEHTALRVFVEGVLLTETTSIDLQTDAGNIRVDTMQGLAGFSPGNGSTQVTVNLGIPLSGQELPLQQWCAERRLVSIQIPIGQEGSFAARGKLGTVGISQSVNAAAEQSFTWEGPLKAVE